MAFTLVTGQRAYSSAGPGVLTTTVVALPNNPTPGNLVVVGALWYNGVNASSAVTSIQDGNGNAYTQPANSPENTNGIAAGAAYEFYLLVAPANADKTITITWTVPAQFASASIREFTASSLPAIFDTSVKGSGTGATINTPTVTRAGANELMILNAITASAVNAANSPWVASETIPTTLGDCLAYILDRSADTAANLGCSSSAAWDAVGMSFQMSPTAVSIAIPAGTLTLGGLAASPRLALNLALVVGALVFTGYAPTISINSPATSIAIPVGSLVLGGTATTPLVNRPLAIPAGSLVFAGQFIAVQFGAELVVGQLLFTGYAPTVLVGGNQSIAIPVGSLLFTGTATLTNGGLSIDVPVGSLLFTGRTPMSDTGIGIPAGSLVFAGQTLSPSLGFMLPVPAGSLVYAGYALIADGIHVIAIPAGSLVFGGQVALVQNGGRLGPGDLTTQFVFWMKTLPAGDINTKMRDALATLYGVSPSTADLSTLLTRFLKDRTL